jgi:hypothetical protein
VPDAALGTSPVLPGDGSRIGGYGLLNLRYARSVGPALLAFDVRDVLGRDAVTGSTFHAAAVRMAPRTVLVGIDVELD